MALVSMTWPMEDEAASSSGSEPVTVNFSLTWPTSRVKSRSSTWLTSRRTFSRTAVEKPGLATVMRYAPGARNGNVNLPSPVVAVERSTAVARLPAVTTAVGTPAPVLSVTVPVSWEVV